MSLIVHWTGKKMGPRAGQWLPADGLVPGVLNPQLVERHGEREGEL